MKQSHFKFKEPFVSKINYEINEKCSREEDLDVPISFSVNISRDKEENLSVVELEIVLGKDEFEEAIPFYIDMTIGAMFAWDNVYDEKTIQSLLQVNAPALLLGYARPLISTITTMSPFPTYNIPFVNFTESEE